MRAYVKSVVRAAALVTMSAVTVAMWSPPAVAAEAESQATSPEVVLASADVPPGGLDYAVMLTASEGDEPPRHRGSQRRGSSFGHDN